MSNFPPITVPLSPPKGNPPEKSKRCCFKGWLGPFSFPIVFNFFWVSQRILVHVFTMPKSERVLTVFRKLEMSNRTIPCGDHKRGVYLKPTDPPTDHRPTDRNSRQYRGGRCPRVGDRWSVGRWVGEYLSLKSGRWSVDTK